MRKLRLALGAILLLGVPVALAGAQTSVPTVAVTAAGGNVTLEPSGPIAAGPTRFTFSGRGELSLATLRAGVSVDQLRRTLPGNDPAPLSQIFLEASVTRSRAVTVDLRPNTTYVAAAIAGRSRAITTFTTGTESGARAPTPDARIRMVDYAFRGPNTLPGNGSIRVDNDGTTFHFALAFPLRSGVSDRQVRRAFRGTNERALERVGAGEPVDVQGLISQG